MRRTGDRALALCPPAVTVVWMGGFASMHGRPLTPIEWLALLAAAFAVGVVGRRLRGRRPPPRLPEGISPMRVSVTIAMLMFALACLAGGVVEWLLQGTPRFASATPWGLRMLWHGAAAFLASLCVFLRRLQPSKTD